MRYLVTTNSGKPFLTQWFDAENHFNASIGMVVYDLLSNRFTKDGKKWEDIIIDNL